MSYDPNAPKVYRSVDSKDRPFCGRCGLEYACVGSGPSRWGTGSREDTYQPQCPCWTAAPKPEATLACTPATFADGKTITVAPFKHYSLREYRRLHSHLFRQDQVWFDRDAFMDVPLPEGARKGTPSKILDGDRLDDDGRPFYPRLPLAVELVDAYIRDPMNPIWDRYLWCRDTDSQGQRVYIGKNNGLMEIHRHLHLTERWGVPLFE